MISDAESWFLAIHSPQAMEFRMASGSATNWKNFFPERISIISACLPPARISN
jgi:hypothetical protein